MKNVAPSPTDLLPRLNLAARLKAAMAKAGVTERVELVASFVHLDYYDTSGIEVKAESEVVRKRATAWVQKALVAAGVKLWHTGAWQGPCAMGDPDILHTTCYGKPLSMVCLITASIGD